MQFEFLPTPKIIFGKSRFKEIDTTVKEFGTRLLIVASKSALERTNEVKSFEDLSDIETKTYIIEEEPTIEVIDSGVESALDFKAEVILGLGGGSSIDASKAIAALTTNGGSAKDYMEVIGKGAEITRSPLPTIAIPTTAGTGSEVTKNAVIFAKKNRFKASIRSPLMIPNIAIIDPILMTSVPSSVTATCGMDALTQLIESYTSRNAQAMTDTLALLGMKKCAKSLILAFEKGDSIEAREDMALAALLSGICLANAGLGAVHGFASPIGGLNIPHGVICASLLALTIETNIKCLKQKNHRDLTLFKYSNVGRILSGKSNINTEEAHQNLIDFLKSITQKLKIPRLSEYGLKESDISDLVEKAKRASSMRYNPFPLSDNNLTDIILQAL